MLPISRLDSITALAVASLVLLSCLGTGGVLLRLCRLRARGGELADLLTAFGLGAGALSLVTLGLGLLGALSPRTLGAVASVGVVMGGHSSMRLLGKSIMDFRDVLSALGPYRVCIAVILLFAIVNGLAAPSPPTDVDALNYHLSVPHMYLLSGEIIPIPSVPLSYLPFNVQMLYLLCLGLGSPAAPQLVHVFFGLGSAAAVASIGRHLYGARTGVLGALLFYTLTDVSAETALGRVDLGVSFFILMAFLAFMRARDEAGSRNWLVVAGIFAGLSAGSKYTALFIPGLVSLIVLLYPPPGAGRIKSAVLVATLSALVAAPWYLRNLAWTGNPFFPFLTELFGPGPLRDVQVTAVQAGNWDYAPIQRTVANFVLSPWLLVVQHDGFAGGRIGPLFLAYLPPFLALRWRRTGRLRPALLFCLLSLPIWFWTSPLVRFLLAPLGLLSVPLARALQLAARSSRVWRRLTYGALGLWLAFALGSTLKNHVPLIPVALGLRQAGAVLDRPGAIEGYQYVDFQSLNSLPRSERVILSGSHGLYASRAFDLAGDWALRHWDTVQRCDAREFEATLRTSDVGYVMTREDLDAGRADPSEVAFESCFRRVQHLLQGEIIYARGPASILKLESHEWTHP